VFQLKLVTHVLLIVLEVISIQVPAVYVGTAENLSSTYFFVAGEPSYNGVYTVA
jgi:hypothetical protein